MNRVRLAEKKAEMKGIRMQISLMFSEIQLRENILKQLYSKFELLQKERNEIDNLISEEEYEILKQNNL